jgi:homopolymeric O-antigen transport system permease protein
LATYLSSARELLDSLWQHRRLAWTLAKRDVRDEHVGQSFGLGWTILQPLLLMGTYLFVFTFVFFTRLENPPSTNFDFTVFLFSGLTPWLTLTLVLGKAPMAVVQNATIVKQVALPLEIIPVKVLYGPAVFFSVALGFMLVYSLLSSRGVVPITYALIPLLIVLLLLLCAGLSLMLSSLGVFFRDIREIINVILGLGLFLLPILYRPGALPHAVETAIALNPFSSLIWCWQDALYYGSFAHQGAWFVNVILSFACFIVGSRLYMTSKDYFGDAL